MKNDNKCFLYVVKMALHYEVIKNTYKEYQELSLF